MLFTHSVMFLSHQAVIPMSKKVTIAAVSDLSGFLLLAKRRDVNSRLRCLAHFTLDEPCLLKILLDSCTHVDEPIEAVAFMISDSAVIAFSVVS